MPCATPSRVTSAAPSSASPPHSRAESPPSNSTSSAASRPSLSRRRVLVLVLGGAGDAALIPGVLFVSDFAIHFSSDRPVLVPGGRAGGDYVRVSLPFERIAHVSPHVDGTERWIGATTVDAHRFWFTGFASFQGARDAVGRAGHAFLRKSAQHARTVGGGGGGNGGDEWEGGGGWGGGGARDASEEPSAPPMPTSR